ncbi:MAG: iron-containing alcohol dehydrogenase, partial [Gammaproteobacteria bacterium]|nr:iron-containing alcohol dehydrogenase [Gammaproteobacteria bacterium]
MITPFSIARLPAIEFGSGSFSRLPQIAGQFGSNVLLVAGGKSFLESRHWAWLRQHWQANAVHVSLCQIRGEPSPVWVDEVVAEFSNAKIDVVIAIGGGSALDAGKAVAGLLRLGRPVTDYLEGVGPELPYEGPAVPFIAVPTTAGTGSEATKNAVLSVQGEDGYKKSFRSDQLIARYAVVDPELLETCPPALIAANGMDALTQLLESYVSTRANPFTDSLALSGLTAVRKGLIEWYEKGASAKEAQTQMAYASLLSGITLAQAGLGSVHGLASPLGAFFPIPHGVACGTLLAEATAVNIQA